MQITIDSTEPLERVLPLINALYGVTLSLPEVAAAPAPKAAARRGSAAGSPKRSSRRNKRAEVTASAVREWARANGHQVSGRGRLPAELVEAYRTAN